MTEGRATGIPKILKVMAANGSPPPVFESDDERTSFVIRLPVHAAARVTSVMAIDRVTTEVTTEVAALLQAIEGEMGRQALQTTLGLKNADHFRKPYLVPATAAGYLEMAPGQPRSRLQRYRLTEQGRQWLHAHGRFTQR